MKIEYKKDLRHNYMIITDQESTGSDTYCIKVLEYQKIEGILPIEQRRLNESVLYYYDISSRQSMAAILDKAALTKERIEQLCTGIIDTLERAYEYLLMEEDFILTPECIFMEVVSNEPSLCFLPGYSKPVKEQMSSLLEYLMNKVDYNDREAVLLVYKLYAVSREEGYTFEQLRNELQEPELRGDSEQHCKAEQQSEIGSRSKPKPQRDSDLQGKSEFKESVKAGHQLHSKGQIPVDGQNTMPMMMEKLEKDVEISCYPLRTFLYTGAIGVTGILIIALGYVTKLIYNTYGDRIDYIKLSALLLIIFCTEGYFIKRIWDKKNKVTRIITQNEYIDPRQFINPPAAGAYNDIKVYGKEQEEEYKGGCNQGQSNNQQFTNNQENINSSKISRDRSALSEDHFEDDNPTCLLNPSSQITGMVSLHQESVSCILVALDDINYQSIPVTDFPFFIGKLKKNVDYCLKEDVVSRYHAKLLKEGDRYYLMDMNSTNGTFVNGEALKTYEKIEIKQGDEISFANIKYKLEIGADQPTNINY